MAALIDYLRLMRASNVLTAVSNILMGFLLASGSWQPTWALWLLIGSSVSLYSAGMVLNDWFDLERDRQLQPQRPLPSGRVPVAHARWMGIGLMILGIGFAWAVTLLSPEPDGGHYLGRSGIVAVCLATCIVAYDGGGKKSVFGPLLMGSCRLLNVLLGCSICVLNGKDTFLGFEVIHWLVAAGIGTYVAGLTWFARYEHQTSRPLHLMYSAVVMAAGIGILVTQFPELNNRFHKPLTMESRDLAITGTLLLMLISPVIWRILVAIRMPNSVNVKRAVVVSLLTLIMIDAAICYLVAIDRPMYGIVVAALIFPTYWLGRWINPT